MSSVCILLVTWNFKSGRDFFFDKKTKFGVFNQNFIAMRSSTSNAQQPVFSEFIFSIPLSLVASHFFMGLKRERNYLQLLLDDGYLLDLLFRSLLAYMAILLVKYVTRYLDAKKPWTAGPGMRVFLQFSYGFLGVVLLDFILYRGYLQTKGIQLAEAGYFNLYTLFICVYVAILNLYYNYSCFTAVKGRSPVQEQLEAAAPLAVLPLASAPTCLENEMNDLVLEVQQKNIVFIMIAKKGKVAWNLAGESFFWHYSTKECSANLPAKDFFQVGRNYFLHRNVVDHLIPEPENDKLELVLKAPIKEKIKVPVDRISGFNQWWAMGKEGAP